MPVHDNLYFFVQHTRCVIVRLVFHVVLHSTHLIQCFYSRLENNRFSLTIFIRQPKLDVANKVAY